MPVVVRQGHELRGVAQDVRRVVGVGVDLVVVADEGVEAVFSPAPRWSRGRRSPTCRTHRWRSPRPFSTEPSVGSPARSRRAAAVAAHRGVAAVLAGEQARSGSVRTGREPARHWVKRIPAAWPSGPGSGCGCGGGPCGTTARSSRARRPSRRRCSAGAVRPLRSVLRRSVRGGTRRARRRAGRGDGGARWSRRQCTLWTGGETSPDPWTCTNGTSVITDPTAHRRCRRPGPRAGERAVPGCGR